jgi:hypothetical protein
MMDRSDHIGLGVSTFLHGLVIAAIALGLFQWTAPKVMMPPSFEVALTDDIGLESRATSHEEAQTAQAQDLGAAEPDAAPDQATIAEEPKPVAQPVATPEPKPVPKPQPKADAAKATGARGTQPGRPRASMLGDVLKGLDAPAKSSGTSTETTGTAPLSAEASRALSAEIRRQIKPFWRAPTGVDADKLVTQLRWRLNPDGTLSAAPALLNQSGKTASNQPQQQLHVEAAIRAVRAAAPFTLPPDFYDNWKLIEFSFDKRL